MPLASRSGAPVHSVVQIAAEKQVVCYFDNV